MSDAGDEETEEAPSFSREAPLPFASGLGFQMARWSGMSSSEWDQIESHSTYSLSAETRKKIELQLFMSASIRHRVKLGIRGKELKKRLNLINGALKNILRCLEYPAFDTHGVVGRINPPVRYMGHRRHRLSHTDDLPVGKCWEQNSKGYQLWRTLRDGGLQELYVRHAFQSPDKQVEWNIDDELLRLHALAYLTQLALADWLTDKGGKSPSGDFYCIKNIRLILEADGMNVGFSMSDEENSWGGMKGPFVFLVRELTILRPVAFASGEQMQFTKLIRKSKALNPRG